MSISTIINLENHLGEIAPAGYYIGLRVGFYAPEAEINTFCSEWVERYTIEALALFDPLRHWALTNVGAARWSEISNEKPNQVLTLYDSYGCSYGAVIAIHKKNDGAKRSIAYFSRPDRELRDAEIKKLFQILSRAHNNRTTLTLTNAQNQALSMYASGKRHKQIAFELEISESAVKARLKSAVNRLGATNTVQAAAIAIQNKLF